MFVRLCDKQLALVWKLWGFPWPGVKNFPGMFTAGPLQTIESQGDRVGRFGGVISVCVGVGGGGKVGVIQPQISTLSMGLSRLREFPCLAPLPGLCSAP